MKKEEIESTFDTYGYYLEGGDPDFFENPDNLNEIERVALQGLESGVTARSLYFLSIVHLLRGEKAKSLDNLKSAAQKGHISAAINYANQIGLKNIDALGILKTYVDAGHDVGQPATDDYKYFMEKLSTEELSQVDQVSQELLTAIEQGDGFVYL